MTAVRVQESADHAAVMHTARLRFTGLYRLPDDVFRSLTAHPARATEITV